MTASSTPPAPPAPAGARTGVAATRDPAATRTFPCRGCGADLEFHIGDQQLACPYCGARQEIEDDGEVRERDLATALEELGRQRQQDPGRQALPGDREVSCSSCGATVVFSGALTSTACTWCGTPLQRDSVHTAAERLPVDGVLPFQIDSAAAATALHRWVASRWFAPRAFVRRGVREKPRGAYLPFWTFDALAFCRYSGQRGDHYWVEVDKKRQRRTRWTPASGSFQRFFDDVLVPAFAGLPARLVRALEPWPLDRLRPFAAALLAGLEARTYDQSLQQGYEAGRAAIEEALRVESRQRIGGDVQRLDHCDSRLDALTYKHLLLPVYLLTYRYRDRPYRVAVNAGTGEVVGERPWSWVKIVLLALVAGALLLYLSR